jgi:hypothetical protein
MSLSPNRSLGLRGSTADNSKKIGRAVYPFPDTRRPISWACITIQFSKTGTPGFRGKPNIYRREGGVSRFRECVAAILSTVFILTLVFDTLAHPKAKPHGTRREVQGTI